MTTNIDRITDLEQTFHFFENKIEYSLACNDFYAVADHLYELSIHIDQTDFCHKKLTNLTNTVICKIRTQMKEFDEDRRWSDLCDAIGALTENNIFATYLTKAETDHLEPLYYTARRKQEEYERGLNELFLTEDELTDIPTDDTEYDVQPFLARK